MSNLTKIPERGGMPLRPRVSTSLGRSQTRRGIRNGADLQEDDGGNINFVVSKEPATHRETHLEDESANAAHLHVESHDQQTEMTSQQQRWPTKPVKPQNHIPGNLIPLGRERIPSPIGEGFRTDGPGRNRTY